MKSHDEILKENELLKREVKALDEEGVMKCELNKKLSKALDKACEELERWDIRNFDNIKVDKKEWREWCLKDENN